MSNILKVVILRVITVYLFQLCVFKMRYKMGKEDMFILDLGSQED